MSVRLPDTAFSHYVSLGAARTYQAVATHFAVSLRTVTKRSAREGWRKRLTTLDERARRVTDARLLTAEVARRKRHFKELLKLQDRALKTLQRVQIRSASEAVEVLAMAMFMERTILGMLRAEVACTGERIVLRHRAQVPENEASVGE